ncbi:MAG: hypothetical protein LBC40_05175, partial [Dysgonamonadaceae bacterium]|nr:hypothetical protein [Dysgonamonadaceae bacterium]
MISRRKKANTEAYLLVGKAARRHAPLLLPSLLWLVCIAVLLPHAVSAQTPYEKKKAELMTV